MSVSPGCATPLRSPIWYPYVPAKTTKRSSWLGCTCALTTYGPGFMINSARKSCPFEESAVERKMSRSPVWGLSISVPILTKGLLSVEQRSDQCFADHQGVVHGSRYLSTSGVGISRNPELSEWR